MDWAKKNFSKISGNPIFGQIFGHQRAKNEDRNTIMHRGQETHPIRVYDKYEMNWSNSFFKKSGNLVYRRRDGRTDGQTDGQTSGWIQYTPIPPSVERGYNKSESFWCWARNTLGKLGPHNHCRYPGSLRRQDINSRGINCVNTNGSLWLTTCIFAV